MKWLDAHTACDLLGVKPASLYAYVSRGKVRAKTADHDPRASLYAAADVEQLLSRKRAGRKRDSIARGAIGWGEPILESAITTVAAGRLIYRGFDAVALSEDQTLEQIASLLWGEAGSPVKACFIGDISKLDSKAAGLNYLAQMAATAPAIAGRTGHNLAQEASALLDGMSTAMALGAAGHNAHIKLAKMWQLNEVQGDIVRRALVLLADHELNPSTFAARVAASTGASLSACALAGFATLTGPFHGEAPASAYEFLANAHVLGPERAVSALKSRGETLAGLGHRLYPDGDPRARALLTALRPGPLLKETIEEAELAWSAPINIDMALAAMTLQLGLPKSAPFTLFAVARMVGWLAHGIEQGQSGGAIRPRARYVGVAGISADKISL
jgi:citrate synthase